MSVLLSLLSLLLAGSGSAACPEALRLSATTGVINEESTHPNMGAPGDTNHSECRWQVRIGGRHTLRVTIDSFSVSPPHACESPLLEVRDGCDAPSAPLVVSSCGGVRAVSANVASGCAAVRIRSDYVTDARSLALRYEARRVPIQCQPGYQFVRGRCSRLVRRVSSGASVWQTEDDFASEVEMTAEQANAAKANRSASRAGWFGTLPPLDQIVQMEEGDLASDDDAVDDEAAAGDLGTDSRDSSPASPPSVPPHSAPPPSQPSEPSDESDESPAESSPPASHNSSDAGLPSDVPDSSEASESPESSDSSPAAGGGFSPNISFPLQRDSDSPPLDVGEVLTPPPDPVDSVPTGAAATAAEDSAPANATETPTSGDEEPQDAATATSEPTGSTAPEPQPPASNATAGDAGGQLPQPSGPSGATPGGDSSSPPTESSSSGGGGGSDGGVQVAPPSDGTGGTPAAPGGDDDDSSLGSANDNNRKESSSGAIEPGSRRAGGSDDDDDEEEEDDPLIRKKAEALGYKFPV